MTKQKQVVFKSPLLVRSGQTLRRESDRVFVVCLESLLEVLDVPESRTYEIEISPTQWSDGMGCEIWIAVRMRYVSCGPTSDDLDETFAPIAARFIRRHLKPPRNKPTRCFFRLLYD